MRSGKLGPITFETVEEWLIKAAEAERLRIEAEEAEALEAQQKTQR